MNPRQIHPSNYNQIQPINVRTPHIGVNIPIRQTGNTHANRIQQCICLGCCTIFVVSAMMGIYLAMMQVK